MLRRGEPVRVLIPRTCCKCGHSFKAETFVRLCADCRKPKLDRRFGQDTGHLSFREKQIIRLIQQAKSNKEIAYLLSLSTGTVKEYNFHIFRKLGIGSRVELALWGRDHLEELSGPADELSQPADKLSAPAPGSRSDFAKA